MSNPWIHGHFGANWDLATIEDQLRVTWTNHAREKSGAARVQSKCFFYASGIERKVLRHLSIRRNWIAQLASYNGILDFVHEALENSWPREYRDHEGC